MILSSHGIIGSSIVQIPPVFLLDDYPGAAAAYSLRLLRSGYTGSAIRVRRSNDNDELDIGFVNNQLDTTSLASFCSGTNGFVKTWYDQSGNSQDATNVASSTQPQIVSGGIFVGFISFVGIAGGQLTSGYTYTVSQNFSSFMVCENEGFCVFGGTSISSDFYAIAQSGAITSSSGNFSTPTYYANGNLIGNTRNDMHNATVNESLISTLAFKTVSDRNLVFSYPYGGIVTANDKYKEFIIYNNQTISRTGVESNIMTYYDL